MKYSLLSFVLAFAITAVALASCSEVTPPEPYGPVPTARQLAWHETEYYAFVHFTTTTSAMWSGGMAMQILMSSNLRNTILPSG